MNWQFKAAVFGSLAIIAILLIGGGVLGGLWGKLLIGAGVVCALVVLAGVLYIANAMMSGN